MHLFIILFFSITFIVLSTTRWQLHPFLAILITAIFYGITAGLAPLEVIKIVKNGFGDTLGQIGAIILFGSIIGKFLEKTGGAFLLAESILKLTGKKFISLTLGLTGYIVSIPVFADSGFIILSSLKKSLIKTSNVNAIAITISLAIGLMASHVMLPPTPGPVAAAGILNADLGLVILLGLPISLFGLICTWLFVTKISKKTHLASEVQISDTNTTSEASPQHHSILRVVLPILIPIFLILLKSIILLPSSPISDGEIKNIIIFLGEPFVALFIGMLFAFNLPSKMNFSLWSSKGWVGEAIYEAAVILLITGAGGAFGKVLQNTAISEVITKHFVFESVGIALPFILAAAIKSAQGSSTVAIITTASLVAPLLESLGLLSPMGTALTVLAIGAGSAVVSHANDSFFWIVTQFSGMSTKDGYRYHSTSSIVLGCSAMFVIYIFHLILV